MLLENYVVRNIARYPDKGLTGRRKIKTRFKEITLENVRDVLSDTLADHARNVSEITYLYNYYKGRQDIRMKRKYVREYINEKVTVNRANEIVAFKTSYLLSRPVQYVSRGGDESVNQLVTKLNDYMHGEDKAAKDKEIVDWCHICGVGERFVCPDPEGKEDAAPFQIFTIDPRDAYVIYSSGIGEPKIGGVVLQWDENGNRFADVYTDSYCYTVTHDSVSVKEYPWGIPLTEYINNEARISAFEVVIPILNAINTLESNAIDAVVDYVNGFDVFQNCDIDDEDYTGLEIGRKAVRVKTVTAGMEAKIYRIVSELNQTGVQTRIDNLTEEYLTICGMPNRNGGTSTSDTGTAVIYRDGFVAANSRAIDSETLFKRSEREFDRVALNIINFKENFPLTVSQFEADFPRSNLDNLQSKFQCFMQGLENPMIHPESMYNAFGDVFGDKSKAYQMGMEWYAKMEEKNEREIENELEAARTAALRAGG